VLLEDDFYWHLPVAAAFDMSQEPETLTVGQLTDDLNELASPGDVDPSTVWHDLSHLIGLLRVLEKQASA